MTHSHDLLAQLRLILRERLRITHPVELETDLFGELQLDSMQLLSLVVELENHFECCFDAGDEAQLRTVADLVTLIEHRQDARQGQTTAIDRAVVDQHDATFPDRDNTAGKPEQP